MREMAVALNEAIEDEEKTKEVRVRFVGSDEVVQHILPLKEKKLVNKPNFKPATPKTERRINNAKHLEDDEEEEEYESDVCSESSSEFLEDHKPSSALSVCAEGLVGRDLFSFRTPKKSRQMLAKATESLTPKSSLKKLSLKTPDKKQLTAISVSTPSSVKRTPRSTVKQTPLSRVKDMEVETPKTATRRSQRLAEGTPRRLWKRNGESTINDAEMETPKTDRRRSRRLAESTPHRLWKRNDENQSESSDSCLSTDDEECSEDRDTKVSVCATPSSSTETLKGKISGTPVACKTGTPSSLRKPELKRKQRKVVEEDLAGNVESYFDAQTVPVHTSDRTLARLETPSMSPAEMIEVLKKSEFKYSRERKSLVSGYRDMFHKWMLLMCHNYNILLYGFGSKYSVIEEFRKSMLKDFSHIVINGYFPSLSIKSVLNSITEDVIQHSGSFSNVVEQYEFIRSYFESEENQDFFLVIHNIDGAMLRSEKSQSILSVLAQIRGFHFIASIDHINASLLWDQAKIGSFRWLWHDVTTFENYTNETSYENSLLIQQTGNLAMSSLVHVMRSLTANARGIFLLLAKHQLDNQDNSVYQGLPFPDFYQRCREAFLVNSELTLRTQLTEFKDHRLIRTKKGFDGVEYLTISLDSSTLAQYMEETESEQK